MNLRAKLKTLCYLLEALTVRLAVWIFLLIGQKKAADYSAKIAQFIGKKLAVHKLAYRNLSNAMPQLSEKEKEKILDDMWDNLGRIIGEFAHIAKYPSEKTLSFIEISEESKNNLKDIKQSGKGGIIFGAHIGNWEIGPKTFAAMGIDTNIVYRPLNNPYVEKITSLLRGGKMIGKGAGGNRKIIEVIKNGGFVAILIDQKISEGDPVKFFHEDALTATAIARIALRYGAPLIPAHSIRLGKDFKFLIEVEKPLAFQPSDNLNSDTLLLTREINKKLEEWIVEYPSQWFWVHNRWKK